MNPLGLFRPSLNFIMETMRSSACTLWVGKTRLEWSWTTQLSLYFSSWIDSTYRLLKPRPQFSSCAASACTCPRTSWPAGVWETSRITSAHTCLIKASSSTQPHREKPLPFLLPKPSEANWCTHLHPFPFKRFELVLGSLLFCYLLVLPSLAWGWFSSHPCFSPSCPNVSPLLSAIIFVGCPIILLFLFFSSLFIPLLLPHPFLFIWTCTNIDFEWLVVRLEPHCQQHRSLKELFMLHQNRNKQYPGLHGGSQMDVFYILVVIRKDC